MLRMPSIVVVVRCVTGGIIAVDSDETINCVNNK